MSALPSIKQLPRLRGLREAYREQLRAAQRRRADASSLREQLVSAAEVDDLACKFHSIGVLLNRLERSPPGGGGGTPAHKGQGRPAPSPAVGPAPNALSDAGQSQSVSRSYITTHAGPLSAVQRLQELPPVNRRVNLDHDKELIA